MRGMRLVVGMLLLASTGCSAGDDEAAQARECQVVPKALLKAIAAQAEASGTVKPIHGAAVRSAHNPEVYFVAMQFAGSDTDNQIGVWATTDLEEGSDILAVDETAQAATSWPDATEGTGGISLTDSSVERVTGCVD